VSLRLPAVVLLAVAITACGGGAPQAQHAWCSGFVQADNAAGAHVKAGLGGDSGFLLENSLRHDGDAARAAAASVSGPGEEIALLQALPSARDVAMVEVLLDTGLRYGELAGLHGHRVDLLRRELHVVETLTQAGQVKAYPKSVRSQRVVPLEQRAVLALARTMEVHGRDGLVFRAHRRSPGKATFGPVVGANWRSLVWQPALERAGIAKPWPTPHDCRHSCLSRLVAGGADLALVQALAGHESLQTTARYVHAGSQVQDRLRAGMRAVADGS